MPTGRTPAEKEYIRVAAGRFKEATKGKVFLRFQTCWCVPTLVHLARFSIGLYDRANRHTCFAARPAVDEGEDDRCDDLASSDEDHDDDHDSIKCPDDAGEVIQPSFVGEQGAAKAMVSSSRFLHLLHQLMPRLMGSQQGQRRKPTRQ